MYLVKTKGGSDKPSKPSVATHSGYQDQDQETHSLEVWAGPAKPGSRRNTDPDFLKGFDEESSEEHQGNVNPTDGYVDCGNHWAPSCMQCGLYKYDCLGDCYWNSAGHCNDHYEEPVVTPLLGWWIHGYQLQITIDKIILIIIWLALKVLVCGIEKTYFYPHWRFRTLAHLSRQSSSARSVSLVLTCHFERLCLKTTFPRVSAISTYHTSCPGQDRHAPGHLPLLSCSLIHLASAAFRTLDTFLTLKTSRKHVNIRIANIPKVQSSQLI